MNELKKQRIAIDAAGVAGCILIVVIGYLFVIAPVFRQNASVLAQHRQLAVLRQKSSAASGNVRQLKGQIESLKHIASHDTLKAASAVRPNARLAEITSLAETRGLTIKGVEPGQSRSESHFQVTPLRLTGTGSFRGCVQFLHDLRRSLDDTVVVDFRLAGGGEPGESQIAFDLNLCWYTVPAMASVGQER